MTTAAKVLVWRRTLIAALVGLVVTGGVAVVPSLRFAYRSSEGHIVVETIVTLVAGLVALLVYGRYRRNGRLSELLLVYAMALLAFSALFLVTIPVLFGQELGESATTWAALLVRSAGAVLLLAAALVPGDRLHRVSRPWREVALVGAALGAVTLTSLLLSAQLPEAVAVGVTPEESGRPVLEGHPLVLIAQILNLGCYATAALLFTRRAARDGDDLFAWFGAGAMLGAWSRVAYLLFPSLFTEWLYVGDLLRLGMYALLLVGAVREITRYWEAQAALAVSAERRRLARDLHDGVIQELGFIRSEAARTAGAEGVGRIEAAAERALGEVRRSLDALTRPDEETLASAVLPAVWEVAERMDARLDLDVDDSVDVPPDQREELVRIAREAVSNALRHSGSVEVSFRLRRGRMSVSDRGRGFDVSAGRPGGFGLISMRERAESIGAVLSVESTPGGGTRVEVSW